MELSEMNKEYKYEEPSKKSKKIKDSMEKYEEVRNKRKGK